ncbi:hypothetical protein FIBSPDRAFT_939238 [Athelia psychrophila]|uniref:Uncharacterized protein n=1 Tax=Athelia psychrophila TaxID=1759441 RepID=A0A165WW55_9AGAM|nr:hypothetical protein FIBSPDRAFT_939238 [Fibularhizoctonia sp. CBS 109695]
MNVIVSKQSPEMTLIRSWHSSTHIQLQSSNEREHCNFHALVDRATRKVTTSWLWFGFTAAYSFSRHGRVYSELHQTHLISAANTRIPMGAAYQNISALIIELNSKTIGGLARTQPFVHTDIASDFFGYSIVGIELVDVTLTSPPEPVHILILNMPCLGYHDKFVTNIWIQFRYTATVSGGNARAIYIFRWAVGDVDAPASLKASKLHQSWESAVVPRPTASACATTGDARERIYQFLTLGNPIADVMRSTLNPDPGWLDLGFKFSQIIWPPLSSDLSQLRSHRIGHVRDPRHLAH